MLCIYFNDFIIYIQTTTSDIFNVICVSAISSTTNDFFDEIIDGQALDLNLPLSLLTSLGHLLGHCCVRMMVECWLFGLRFGFAIEQATCLDVMAFHAI